MSPIAPSAVNDAQPAQLQKRSAVSQFRDQWWNPSDIFSLLLIIGPDIIQAALVQQAGYVITPTVFSFGWVAYAFNSLLAVFGDTSMTPSPDFPAQIINAKYCHVRENKSWIIGRLLRDQELSRHSADNEKGIPVEEKRDFQISFFRFDQNAKAEEIKRDWIWFSGFPVMLIQLVVSIIPIIIKRNWAPVTITAGGTVLALLHGGIPQWKREKWAGSTKCGPTVSITQGNGSRYIMVVLGTDPDHRREEDTHKEELEGLNIEMLASDSNRSRFSLKSRAISVWLVVLWTVLLISVTGLEEDTWYLIAVGLIGMIHSIFVAGAARPPGALGVHLIEEDRITTKNVPDALKEAEDRYKFVGSSLVPTFFPGKMRIPQEDEVFWEKASNRRGLSEIEELNIFVENRPHPLPNRTGTGLAK